MHVLPNFRDFTPKLDLARRTMRDHCQLKTFSLLPMNHYNSTH